MPGNRDSGMMMNVTKLPAKIKTGPMIGEISKWALVRSGELSRAVKYRFPG